MYPGTGSYKLEKYRAKYSNATDSSARARYSKKLHYYLSIEQAGGAKTTKTKKCKIDPTDTIVSGHGGSNTLIIITAKFEAYKVFPLYYLSTKTDDKTSNRIKKQNAKFKLEIKTFRELTKHIVDPNISPHYVRWIDDYECSDIKELLDECPKTYFDFLKLDKKASPRLEKLCSNLYKGSPVNADTTYHVMQMEYCNYTCSDFIKDLSKMPVHEIMTLLDIFFFQIIYTVLKTQEIYPYFGHSDLFMRNIMGNREKDNCNYYTYKYGTRTYYVPQKLFFPKITDFGYTTLTEDDYKIFGEKPTKTRTRDIYNLIYDVYDGSGLGGESLMSLCKDVDAKKAVRSYFSTFFNTDAIDSLKLESKKNMEWDWSVLEVKKVQQEVGLADPIDLMEMYFSKIFSSIHSEVAMYGK